MQDDLTNAAFADPLRSPVVVWDDDPIRSERILQELRRVDSIATRRPSCPEEITACPQGTVIVLTLSPNPVSREVGLSELTLIRTLKANSCHVVCLVDGRGSQDLARVCRALLAGATRVIDTQAEGFLRELCRTVRETAEQMIGGRLDDANLSSMMERAGFAGRSPKSLALFRSVRSLSPLTDLPVLITGETGTGKELIALAIHSVDSKRAHRPFVSVNCAALTEQLAESELFGHQRGSFTGAERDRSGLFRAAEGGVLFLDEVGELSLTMQAKLLRVLQTNRLRSVGADREAVINVRVISATNRALDQMIREGSFRSDLYHRLNVLSLQIPPLRERREDIAPLIRHFIQQHASLRPTRNCPPIAQDFIDALERSELPGNARQLENVVRRALVDWDGCDSISLNALPPEIWREISGADEVSALQTVGEPTNRLGVAERTDREFESQALEYLQSHGWNLCKAVRHLESVLVRGAVSVSGGNQSEAARLLGVTPRSVYNKLHQQFQP
jgi:DNA-binding NtrC family response regulator